MISRSLSTALAGCLLLAGLAAADIGRGATPLHAADAALGPFKEMLGDCEYHCRDCGSDKHDIVVHYSTNKHKSAHLETCNPGSCTPHDCSQVSAVRLQDVWNRLYTADETVVAKVLADNADIAEFDPDRRSVLIYCQAGNLVANFPLDERTAAALE